MFRLKTLIIAGATALALLAAPGCEDEGGGEGDAPELNDAEKAAVEAAKTAVTDENAEAMADALEKQLEAETAE